MLDDINFEGILFLDIETVPMAGDYNDMPEVFRNLWDKKAEILIRNDKNQVDPLSPESIFSRAGIYAEFGKIICISTAIFHKENLFMKSFYGDNEKNLLSEFSHMLDNAKKVRYLCAHNGREFDYPYMIRRMLVNGVRIPELLDLCMKKNWEIKHLLDTMDLWKFGDYKSYTSLELLAALFGIPTPKDDINGADVARVYYAEQDLPRIVDYCQKDVFTIVNLFLKFQGKSVVKTEQIIYR